MDTVLITGFPGFLGSALLPRILQRRPDQVAVCIIQERWRSVAEKRLASLIADQPDLQGRVQLVGGDITQPGLGISPTDAENVTEVFHLAAVYDLSVAEELATRVNVDGTSNVIDFCLERDNFQRLQYVSTCYVSGSYPGTFHENDLDVGQQPQNFYEKTKLAAERLVREAMESGLPASVYRPGIVVGDSTTGETQKYDGPYFLARMLKMQPRFSLMPKVANPDEVVFSMVPRDFVLDGIDALSTTEVAVGKTYALTDPNAPTVRQLIDTFSGLLDRRVTWVPLPLSGTKRAMTVTRVERAIGIPAESLDYLAFPTRYDTSNATTDLAALGIRCPSFDQYAPNLIRYYRNHPEISSAAMV